LNRKNLRTYGKVPFNTVVIHGGPGVSGEMAPVARKLVKIVSGRGVLEPFQTAISLQGQTDELKTILENSGDLPVTLIGFSWGAWLGFILAAKYPAIVNKLILVGSGVFEEKYAKKIQEIRLDRLSNEERSEIKSLLGILNNPLAKDKNRAFARYGEILLKADAYDPVTDEPVKVDCRFDIFQSVWRDAEELRKSGKLLKLGNHIRCPVVAIHGDCDPHPAKGVEKPLSSVLKNFRFILLVNCGHMPWLEKKARDRFYKVLKGELHEGI
jgi:pimeloyl-ACP methyl ester carboxylesterase